MNRRSDKNETTQPVLQELENNRFGWGAPNRLNFQMVEMTFFIMLDKMQGIAACMTSILPNPFTAGVYFFFTQTVRKAVAGVFLLLGYFFLMSWPFRVVLSSRNKLLSNRIQMATGAKIKQLATVKPIFYKVFKRFSSLCVPILPKAYTNMGAGFPCPGILLFCGTFAVIHFIFFGDAWAVTDADFAQEVTKGEKFITGGYMRLGLFIGCGIAGIIGMVKQSVMMLVIAAGSALFVLLMKDWINTNFAAVI